MRLWARRYSVQVVVYIAVALGFASSPALALSDLALGSLAQQGKHHDIIRELQGALDRGEAISSFQLLFLGGSYYEVRQYRGLLSTADVMEKRIAQGDRSNFGGDLSIYPQLFRAMAALDLGDYERAVQYASDVREHLRTGQFFYRFQLIQTAGVLGVADAFLGRPEEAKKQLEAIRGVSTSMSNIGPEKFATMARIHMALKDYQKALAAISDEGAATSGVLTLFYDPTFQNLPKFFIRAKCEYETGDLDKARQGYDQLLKHPQITQFGDIYWLTLLDRANIAKRDGNPALAEELLRKAADVVEQQRSSIDTDAGRIGFVGDKQAIYEALVALLVQRRDAAGALGYVERAKARALVDMLAGKHDFSVPAGSAERVSELLAASDSAEQSARAFEATMQATDVKRNLAVSKRAELSQVAPELSSLVTVNAADANTLQTLLPADETLVEYFYSGKELYAFVATRSAISAAKLDGQGLDADISDLRRAVQDPASSRWQEPAKKLYTRLIAPIRDHLGTPNLLVVGHGALHYIPFNALHDGSRFLVESYSIRLLPAATVLKFLKAGATEKPGALLAFGNPDLGDKRFDLVFAQKEAERVARILPKSRALVGKEASRVAFRKYASDFRFLHIASHGEFDADHPLASSLLLAPDGPDDGRLTVSDLYSMRVDADLVTLSACETGLGKVANGDDVVGLTRGFLYAGTRTIVASLWQVDDRATSELMASFYDAIGKGLSKREALRAGQREQLARQPHPFFWAAFQLTGSP
ncbi:MAG: CHAT domain-containing protein [Betaproteobacteria bacterium]|nr:CHAT domain-containing protein [Betaproteobacteria bacterium]